MIDPRDVIQIDSLDPDVNYLNEDKLLSLIQNEVDYLVIDNPKDILGEINEYDQFLIDCRSEAEQLSQSGMLKDSGYGKDSDYVKDKKVRGDQFIWLSYLAKNFSDQNDQENSQKLQNLQKLVQQMTSLSAKINMYEKPINQISDFEVQLASYNGSGEYYLRHKDAFRLDENNLADNQKMRKYTLITYLNPNLEQIKEVKTNKLGQLRLYLKEKIVDIVPHLNRSILFKSESVEHEVKPTVGYQRFAVTTWFRHIHSASLKDQDDQKMKNNLNEIIQQYKDLCNFSIDEVDYKEAKNAYYARIKVQRLYKQETYYLQIDSHMRFVQNWDEILIGYLNQCSEPQKSILTIYPRPYKVDQDFKQKDSLEGPLVMAFKEFSKIDGLPRFSSKIIKKSDDFKKPFKSLFWAAGFSFSYGKIIEDCGYEINFTNSDTFIDDLFFGEEIYQIYKFYKKGYELYSPPKTVVYHLWERAYRKTYNGDHSKDQSRAERQSLCIKAIKNTFLEDKQFIKEMQQSRGLPLIEDSIFQADFISIDTEFSGKKLNFNMIQGYCANDDEKSCEYDSVEVRYQKIKAAVQRFSALQIGLCCFRWDESAKKYKCRPFSFYIFPKSKINDNLKMFQAYYQLDKQIDLKQQCYYKITKNFPSIRSYTALSATHQKELEEMMKRIELWVYDQNSYERLTFQIPSYSLKKALSKEVTRVYMGAGVFTEFQRNSTDTIVKKSKSFRQTQFLRENVPTEEKESQSTIEIPDDEEMKEEYQTVDRPNIVKDENANDSNPHQQKEGIQDKNIIQIQLDQEVNTLFNYELGFSRVIQIIIDSKKPIVGHNMMYDAVFIYRHFIGDLPNSFELFARSWLQRFPETYDTKAISLSTNYFYQTDLKNLYNKCVNDKKLRNNLNISLDKEQDSIFGLYDGIGQEHDAGYDAYMTGYIFACISKYIEIGKIIEPARLREKQIEYFSQDNINNGNSNSRKAKKGKKQKNQLLQNDQETDNKEEFQEIQEIFLVVDDEDMGYKTSQSPQKIEKLQDSPSKLLQNGRGIKHYSMVQNKQIYYPDLKEFKNQIILSTDIPRYFSLEGIFNYL
ncbi:c transferase [Stylonychia lemnae]|uniref:C transferase n=1 Tax=Stylonychia lemnae TaxID=5949 RepID=A0A078B2V1_STYLE|nr:c transferase [Stylonychia lemnae]|eukprot:CDW88855.1 c transferase [Stylonychia lemnae]